MMPTPNPTTSLRRVVERMTTVANFAEIMELRDRGAILYIGHSAGKDSAAMFEALVKIWDKDKIRVIHADLGEIEHAGAKEFIRANIDGHDLMIAKAFNKAGDPVEPSTRRVIRLTCST